MGNRRVVTPEPFDRSPGTFAISSDSRTVYFTAEDAGLIKIYSVPAAGGMPTVAVEPERGTFSSINIASDAPGTYCACKRSPPSERSSAVALSPISVTLITPTVGR